MLKYRLITGPILIILFLLLVWADDNLDRLQLNDFFQGLFLGKENPPRGLLLFALALAVAPLAAKELSAIFRASGIASRTWLTSVAAMLGLILSYSIPTQTPTTPGTGTTASIAILSTGIVIVFLFSLITFSRQQNVEGVVAAAGAVVFAMVYLGLMLGFFLALRREHSAWLIVGVIFTTKACDTGAYFTGRLIGKHKMIPWLSPGKTWEGLAGGLITSALVGMGLAMASSWLPEPYDNIPWWIGIIGGIIFGAFGQLGDLIMSLFKRDAGIKDSSTILPGLGGILDVLDSPLLVAPIAYWFFEVALTDPGSIV